MSELTENRIVSLAGGLIVFAAPLLIVLLVISFCRLDWAAFYILEWPWLGRFTLAAWGLWVAIATVKIHLWVTKPLNSPISPRVYGRDIESYAGELTANDEIKVIEVRSE